ncbi:MAG: NAD-binding protein [Anaerolineales bacterium]|nr:NAD-binding protein [Anaerolineales bacterium]MCB9128303.1 NAD-binding protein [Ardenticatenales bacterium]MCB9172094.1 NAD-binding protein [Ardenticatenales bacterium]
MKFLPSQLYHFIQHRPSRTSILTLVRYLLFVIGLIIAYSIIFHYIMAYEGQTEHSWMTGFYWTLTVMSTLGFGDITFQSDLGRFFSSVVLVSGIFFLLILLPFTFIEFFYAPWMRIQAENRAPTRLPESTQGHVILTTLEPVSELLIKRLQQFQYEYVLLVEDAQEALRLHDLGYRVMRGPLDSPDSYRRARTEQARLVATTTNDMRNTNVAYTVREISDTVPVLALASSPASVDILHLAGSNHVLQLAQMLGEALARRIDGGDTAAHVIGQFKSLVIAEAAVAQTALEGLTVQESQLSDRIGVTVLGVWERGRFEIAQPATRLSAGTMVVMVGQQRAIDRYNETFASKTAREAPALVVGGGRVGRAVGQALEARGVPYCIVERNKAQVPFDKRERYVIGDAAEIDVLEAAGIMQAETIVISTHDDDTNIYLTIYCRRLRPSVRIISRATQERNIETLHRAGADYVMSYASMGANAILTLLDRSDVLMVAEGLDIFRVPIPPELAGVTLVQSRLRERTGCMVVAWQAGDDLTLTPHASMTIPVKGDLVVIGTAAAEARFLDLFGG